MVKIPKVLKQGLIFAASKLIARVILFIALVIFARAMGPSHYGVFTLVLTLSTLFGGVAGFGGTGYLIQKHLRGKDVKEEFKEFFFTYLLTSVILSSVVSAFVKYLGYSLLLALATFALSLSYFIYLYAENLHVLGNRIRFLSIASVMQRAITAVLMIILPKKTLFMAFSYFTGFISSALYLLKKELPKLVLKIKTELIRLEYLLPTIFLLIAAKVPHIIVGTRFGMKSLGYLGAAGNIITGLIFIIQESMKIIGIRGGRSEKYRTFTVVSTAFAILVLVVLFLSKPLIFFTYRVIYGDKFTEGAEALFILMLGIPASLIYEVSKYLVFRKSLKKYTAVHAIYAVGVIVSSIIANSFYEYLKLVMVSKYLEAISSLLFALS